MKLSRRELLRLAPLLPCLPGALARAAPADAPRPKNLVLLFHPNGLEPGWKPSMRDGKLVLPPVLSALAPFADRLLCVHGLKNSVRHEVMAHAEGMAGLWTGAQIESRDALSAHPSFDQLVAERVSAGLPFSSLELGVQSQLGLLAGGNESLMIYGRQGRKPPEDDPAGTFRRLFGGVLDADAQRRVRAERQSVLDFVKADLARIRPAYGAAEQQKLDAHLDGVRALERRLDDVAAVQGDPGGAPTAFTNSQLAADANFPAIADLQMDQLVLALKCGLTRVASLQLANSVSGLRIEGVNSALGMHPTFHTGTREQKVLINRFFVGLAARLLSKLTAAGLLDDTLVVWGSEMAVGNHLRDPVPFFVAGGHPTLGPIQQGRVLELPELHRTTRLFMAVLEALGIAGTVTLGDVVDESSRGPLPGVLRAA